MKVLIHLNSQASWSTLCPGSFWTPLQICGIPSKSIKLNVASKANNTVSVSSDESSTIEKKLSCGAPAWRGGKGKRGEVRGGSYHRCASQMGHLTSITTNQMSQLPSKKPRTSQTCKPLLEIKTSRLFTGLCKTVKIRRAGSLLSQKCWISKKCMKQFYDQEIK